MSVRRVLLVVAVSGAIVTSACAAESETHQDGYLGVFLEPVPEILAVHLGLTDGLGVVAGDVAAESPADKAGIMQYDVIVSLNGKDVKNSADFAAAIREAGAGAKVKLGLVSKGQKKEVEVTLGALKDSGKKDSEAGSKSGRRLLRPGHLPVPGRPDIGRMPRIEPFPEGPDMKPFVWPDGSDERLEALEDRMSQLEKQQAEILEKLDRLLAK
jgi:membrane-associated protease RseP (regulator of RpoE activity)